MFHLEHIFHEAPPRGRACRLRWILPRTGFGTSAWPAWWFYLGYRNRIQSGGGELYGRGNLLCYRPVCPHGGGTLGSSGLEGIRQFRSSREIVSGADVCFLRACDFSGGASERLERSATLGAAV